MKKILIGLSSIGLGVGLSTTIVSCKGNFDTDEHLDDVPASIADNYALIKLKNNLKHNLKQTYSKFEINSNNLNDVKIMINDIIDDYNFYYTDQSIIMNSELEALDIKFFWRFNDEIDANEEFFNSNSDVLIPDGTILDLNQDNFAIGIFETDKIYYKVNSTDEIWNLETPQYESIVFHNTPLDLASIDSTANLNLGEFSRERNLFELKEQAVEQLTNLMYEDRSFINNEVTRSGISGKLFYSVYDTADENYLDLDLASVQIFDTSTKLEITSVSQIKDGLTYEVIFYGDSEVTINDTSSLDFTFTTKQLIDET